MISISWPIQLNCIHRRTEYNCIRVIMTVNKRHRPIKNNKLLFQNTNRDARIYLWQQFYRMHAPEPEVHMLKAFWIVRWLFALPMTAIHYYLYLRGMCAWWVHRWLMLSTLQLHLTIGPTSFIACKIAYCGHGHKHTHTHTPLPTCSQ